MILMVVPSLGATVSRIKANQCLVLLKQRAILFQVSFTYEYMI